VKYPTRVRKVKSDSRPLLKAAAIIILLSSVSLPLFGHGTVYEVLSQGVVGIRAAFDTGEPMAKAKVLVFPPGETQPAFETSTDGNGIACIAPDRTGTWILQVRAEGGHGMRINLEVNEEMMLDMEEGESSSSFSTLQKILMAACVCWGLIGTAFFFKRREKNKTKGG
jgi:nickel transport protein